MMVMAMSQIQFCTTLSAETWGALASSRLVSASGKLNPIYTQLIAVQYVSCVLCYIGTCTAEPRSEGMCT